MQKHSAPTTTRSNGPSADPPDLRSSPYYRCRKIFKTASDCETPNLEHEIGRTVHSRLEQVSGSVRAS